MFTVTWVQEGIVRYSNWHTLDTARDWADWLENVGMTEIKLEVERGNSVSMRGVRRILARTKPSIN